MKEPSTHRKDASDATANGRGVPALRQPGVLRGVQQTDAVLDVAAGEYTLTYTDENGEEHQQMGGGKAFDVFGRERDVTEEEIMEHLDMPDVEYRGDGTVWVYYHGSATEITDRFEDGVCYVQVNDGGKTLYLTVKDGGGYCVSETKYQSPDSFN